ncbi:hypothetical protein SDC9_102088 [bioreactor metagenome]|uniref:Uncharacterized protein n=1 Tax=bioreactor metagenome TaxID=1076179 RepID=A0A645B0K9_9ZZZZ
MVQHPPAKSDHVSPHVDDGEHQTISELVVKTAAFVLHCKARAQKLRLGVALMGHSGDKRVPPVGRRAKAEADRRGLPDLPPVQIVPHGAALRVLKLLIVKPGRVAVQIQKAAPLLLRLPVPRLLRNLQPGAPGEKPHRVRKGEAFLLHDKVDDAAAPLAAEAVINLLVRGDGEGAGLLAVKRAEAKVVRASSRKLDIAAHHIHNVAAGRQLVQKILRKRQRNIPPSR